VALAHCSDPAPQVAQEVPPAPGERDIVDHSFADLDTNGDGLLSTAETRDVPALRDIFSLADRDQDGSLNVPEYSHATLEGTRVSADAARGPLFLALDLDDDGRISPEEAAEVPQLQRNFGTFDTNGDGSLNIQEYMSAQDEGLTPED
jgi:Ca2+-binding EF-hand superfamily protein